MAGWKQSSHPGVRYREHPSRKHGVKKDRYFSIYYRLDGKRHEEGLGWASGGWTVEKSAGELSRLKEAHRTGRGEHTLKERRESQRNARAKSTLDALTFGELFSNRYFPETKPNKSTRSWKREESLFRLWIEPVIGSMRLKDVSPINLEKIKSNMTKEKLAPRSVEYALAVIRQVFNYARRNDLYQGDSPTSKVTRAKKKDNRRVRFLSLGEADELLKLLVTLSLDVHDMALLSLHTGMRAGEIFSLTWADADLERGILTLRDTKAGRTRMAFLTEKTKEMLNGRPRGEKNDLIFSCRDGKKRTEISNTFDRAVDKLKWNDDVTDNRQRVVFHTLRHTFASWLVESGVDLYTVKELLGHRSIAMTERYSHLGDGTLQGAVRTLERNIEQARKSNPSDIDRKKNKEI